jgi:hypothetical protein
MKNYEDAFYRAKTSILGANIMIKGSGEKACSATSYGSTRGTPNNALP